MSTTLWLCFRTVHPFKHGWCDLSQRRSESAQNIDAMYSEGTCCESKGTFASTTNVCLGGGGSSKIVVSSG